MAESAAQSIVAGETLGLGSGSAVARFAKALGERIKSESIRISVRALLDAVLHAGAR